jgi:hypothetical protein
MTMTWASPRAMASRSRSAAVGVSTTVTPSGAGTARFAARSVTSAPRLRASSATATPMRPDERLPRNRTASSCSRVPPAETTTRRPASGPVGAASARSTASAISSGSDILPGPDSPSASSPSAGPTNTTPRARSISAFACVAGCRHMRTFIAGATTTGPSCASAASVRRSSASPWASRASELAVSGATTSRSARPRCGYGSSLGNVLARAKKVSGATKRAAPSVTIGNTSWPARTSRRTRVQAL